MSKQMIEQPKTCHTESCDKEPVVRSFWPGKSPPPEYCFECAVKFQGIAEAMGFTLHQEPLIPRLEE